ncbi:tyrosine-protein phosphatase YopH [Providencia rustigianii]
MNMFPINLTRPSVSQAIVTPAVASSEHSNLSESLQCIKNISQTENVSAKVKPTLKKRLGLKLNFAVLAQQSAFDKLQVQTTKIINEKGIEYDTQKRGQLYPEIGAAKQTQVSIMNKNWERVLLSANRLAVNDMGLAIRCQYPRNNTQAIENHLTMLVDNRVPLLVVLSSNNEIKPFFGREKSLPSYFISSKKYGEIKVKSLRIRADYQVDRNHHSKSQPPLKFNQYNLEINDRGRKHHLPVIHITNWGDGNTISTGELKKLSRMVNVLTHGSLIKLKKYHNVEIDGKNKPLPVIHCKAGIGRTGVLAAAMQLTKKDNTLTVDDVVTALRTSGNANMVQTEAQYNTLLELQQFIQAARKMSS